MYALYQQVMQQRAPLRQEVRFQFQNDSVKWFELCVAPTQEGISSLGLDISERHQLTQRQEIATAQLEQQAAERTADLQAALDAAHQASAAKSTFLSGMSHELRTPMNTILGFSQLLQMQTLPDKQMVMVTGIRRAGQHLLALIDDLLDLTRVESGKVALSITPMLLADAVRLRQVIVSLLTNAAKYNREHGPCCFARLSGWGPNARASRAAASGWRCPSS